MLTYTYSIANWDTIADTLDLGYPAVPFGTGTACRIAPELADWIREQTSAADDDSLTLTFDWDAGYVIGCALTVAKLEGGDAVAVENAG